MTINWTDLNGKTANYNNRVQETDPVSGLITVTFCGLYAKMSDILKDVDSAKLQSVAVFCDTLVMDTPELKASGVTVAARNIDLSSLNGKAITLNLTDNNTSEGAAQFMVYSVTGADKLEIAGTVQGNAPIIVPIGIAPLNAPIYAQAQDGSVKVLSDENKNVANLAQLSWSLSSLSASYVGAAWIIDNGEQSDRPTAQQMLSWIVANVGSLVAPSTGLASDYAELYNQSSALLVILNVEPGAIFVPVLSADVYGDRMDTLVSLLAQYEQDMNTLDTREDIQSAITTVSASLQSVAQSEMQPLTVQLDNIKVNTAALKEEISDLTGDFLRQQIVTDTSYNVMQTYISLENIRKQLEAEISAAMTAVSTGFSAMKVAAGDPTAAGGVITGGVSFIQQSINIIENAGNAAPGSDSTLGKDALGLLKDQQALMQALQAGELLNYDAQQGETGKTPTVNPAAINIDPVTRWNNYVASAEASLASIQRGGGAGAAAADTVLANIKILAGYGRAIGSKYASYVSQLVRAGVLISQIKAAEEIQKNWENVEKSAQSDQQKLVALKALVENRAYNIKRSVFVAWNYYAAAYYFLNFQTPVPGIHIDMDSKAMRSALIGVDTWVQEALEVAPDGQHVNLPSNDASISLEYTVLQPDTTRAITGDVAQLVKNEDNGFSLMWTLPVGSKQLKGVLPNGGNCAIWITEAEFIVDGVTPNSKGNLISTVSTSGSYENGFGLADNNVFVTKGLKGNFLYSVTDKKVYSPWKIDSVVFMTPTPYTQWTMSVPADGGDLTTATKLTVKIHISYLAPAALRKAG